MDFFCIVYCNFPKKMSTLFFFFYGKYGICDPVVVSMLFVVVSMLFEKKATTWQNQQNDCAPSEDSDQPGHPDFQKNEQYAHRFCACDSFFDYHPQGNSKKCHPHFYGNFAWEFQVRYNNKVDNHIPQCDIFDYVIFIYYHPAAGEVVSAATSGLPNPTHLDGEVRFVQAQGQHVTTRSSRIVTECLLTRWMLIKMYVHVQDIYSGFRTGAT